MCFKRNLRKLKITVFIVIAFLLALPSYAQPAKALNFDGIDDFVDCGVNAGFSNLGLTGFTLEAWINLSDVSNVNSVVRKCGDYNFYISEGTLHAEVWPLGTTNDSWQLTDGSIAIELTWFSTRIKCDSKVDKSF